MLSSIPFLDSNLFQFLLLVILSITTGCWLGIILSEVTGGYEIR